MAVGARDGRHENYVANCANVGRKASIGDEDVAGLGSACRQ